MLTVTHWMGPHPHPPPPHTMLPLRSYYPYNQFIRRIVFTIVLIMNFFATKAYYSPSAASDIVQHQWIHEGNKFITTRRKDGTIVVAPMEQRATALVLWIHGLGDSSKGWVDVAEQFITQIPYVKFILPTAPIHPVTLHGGETMTSWYDIIGFQDKFDEPCHGILESRDMIHNILTKEQKRSGIPFSRMVLAGHSQGGSVSLFTGLTLPVTQKLAGILVLSGYLASGKHTFHLTSGLQDTPILHCHGTEDNVVAYEMAKRSKDLLLTTYGVQSYTIKSYPMGHTISEEELLDALTFLRTIVVPSSYETVCSSTR